MTTPAHNAPSAHGIATAMQRVAAVVQRRPDVAVSGDAPASAQWDGGLRVVTRGPHSMQVITDMPTELGGGGEHVSPGWLLRAALASCAVTRIAMSAAAEGITLRTLQADASSRTDVRGLLGVAAVDGAAVPAQALDVQLRVTIAAPGVAADRLQALVAASCALAPVSCAMAVPVAVGLQVEVLPA